MNSVVKDPATLLTIPIRTGEDPVYIRDVGYVNDSADAPAGYALANGRRAVYILATKRADASTMSVISNIKKALPEMQALLPDDIKVSFEFDQSPYVTRAVSSVVLEGALGAFLVGLAVLVFLRDWRSALVVVLNIPLALCCAVLALWLPGETINVMTLGGLALAIGILVDEATVEVENIHTQMVRTDSIALAVRLGNAADRRASIAGDALHSGGFHSGVLHARCCAATVHAAGAGGRVRHDRLLLPVQHVRAGRQCLAAAARSRYR